MPEEHGDRTGAPEHTELEHSDFKETSSQREPGGEELHDITVDHVMEPERDDMMDNSSPPGEVTRDITIDQGQMGADIGDEQDSDGLIEEKTDLVEEESGDLIRINIGTPEGLIGKTSVPTENSSTARKKGTAVIVGPNHKFTIQSRYLSSPIGSCHDFCKFGHRHEAEKKISPTSGMIRRARLMRTQSHVLSKSAPKEETKKKTFIRQLSLPSSIEEEDSELPSVEIKNSKRDLNNSKLKRLQSEIMPSSIPTSRQTGRRKSEIQPTKKVFVRNFNLLESSSLGIKAIKTKKEKGGHSMSEKGKGKEPTASSSLSPKTLVKKSPSMKARLYKNVKSFSHPSTLSSSKEGKIDRSGNVPEKTLYMIEPDTEKKPAKRASRFSPSNENFPSTSRGPRVSKSNDSKANQKGNRKMKEQSQLDEGQPEWDSVNTKQIDTITEDGASNTPTTKSPMGLGGSRPNTPRAKSTMEGGESKPNTPRAGLTVEGDRSKPNTPRTRSTVEGGESKPNTPRAAESTVEHEGSKPNTLRAKSTKGHGGSKPKSTMGDGGSKPSTPRAKSTMERKTKGKGKGIGPEEKDGPAWKVKFKKGTVVAIQTANNAPKKLLFKRGKILGDDQTTKDGLFRILKNRDRRGNEPRDAKQPESRNVRLRHQEASSRKESVDLNNVIEETASQLVKTRKSKVKALVGAFETLMSLRDRKAMAETSAS